MASTEEELAIICGSHSGEPHHREIVDGILRKAGLSDKDLECGAANPYNQAALHELWHRGDKPTCLFNCCSGKHAGMLILAKHMGWSESGYTRPDHPVQVMIHETITSALDISPVQLMQGHDDCGTLPS